MPFLRNRASSVVPLSQDVLLKLYNTLQTKEKKLYGNTALPIDLTINDVGYRVNDSCILEFDELAQSSITITIERDSIALRLCTNSSRPFTVVGK